MLLIFFEGNQPMKKKVRKTESVFMSWHRHAQKPGQINIDYGYGMCNVRGFGIVFVFPEK